VSGRTKIAALVAAIYVPVLAVFVVALLRLADFITWPSRPIAVIALVALLAPVGVVFLSALHEDDGETEFPWWDFLLPPWWR
jgi:predicted benzoate:H+ symporter BenE